MAHGDHLKYSGKPKAGKKTFLRLVSYVACDRRLLIVIGVLIVVSIAANLTGSYMLRPIINNYILPGDFHGLVRILLILAGIYLTGVAATYIEYILLNKIGQRTVTRMREELFGKMERLPVKYFDTHQHGDVMSRYTNDIDRISDALTDSLSDMLSSALTVAGIFCLMLFISPILTAVTLITVPLMFLSAKGIVKRSRKYFKAQQESLGMMNGYVEEMISGQKVVKVFGHEQKVETDFGILNQSLKEKSLKAQFYSGLMMPVMQNLNTLNYVIITIVGALLAIFRGFDVGGLAAFLQYSRQFGRPINELASLYNSIQAAIAGAERIFEIIDEAPEQKDAPDAITLKKTKGDVALKNVYFGYRPEKTILKGVSLHAAAGKKIALVGATVASPRWNVDARAAFIGIGISTSKEDMLRSVLEGVGYNLRVILELLEQIQPVKTITMIGGGVKSMVWRQILSDIYGKKLEFPQYLEEATSMGAAICAGVGIGIFADYSVAEKWNMVQSYQIPKQQNVQLYEELYRVFNKSYESLKDVFGELGTFRRNNTK